MQATPASEVKAESGNFQSRELRWAQPWQWLAQAWQAQQQPLRALRAQAEAQVAVRDYNAALDRLKAAQDMALRAGARADHIEASIIDTRLRAVAALAREQARQQ